MEASLPVLLGGIGTGWLISGGAMAVNKRLGLALASLMGMGVSLYLGVQKLAAAGGSICSIDETFNCDVVNQSAYSTIAGIPIAFLGTGFYAAVLAVSLAGLLRPKGFDRAGDFVLAGGVVAVLYSAFLAYASSTLGAWCLFCISMYGVNAIILAGGWLTRTQGLGAAFGDKEDRSLSTMVTSGLVVFIGAMAWYNSQSGGVAAEVAGATAGGEPDIAAYAQLMEQTEGPLTLDGTEPVLGNPTAPYTIVEFADFQCPGCAATKPLIDELVSRNDNVRVLYKNYPLSNVCNPSIGREFHVDACRAAAAAECAHKQGRFWDLAHLMFKNQKNLDADGLAFMANQVGLDAAAFSACLDDPATMAAVEADVAAGNRVGVHGTPSLFLKGTHGDTWVAMTAGPEGAELLVRAHAEGKELPAPPAPEAHEH